MTQQPKKRGSGGKKVHLRMGGRKPFTKEQVQLIRMHLRAKGDLREIALFETALSAMLRVSDLLTLTVDMVRNSWGEICPDFVTKQKKTRKAVTVSLDDAARAALGAYLASVDKSPSALVWTQDGRSLKRLTYARMVKEWARMIHLDPRQYSTHSLRKTQAAHIYRETNNIEAVRDLLGHGSVATTSKYLGLSSQDARELKRKHAL